MSKGSTPRPYGVSLDTYGDNFDRIFGKPAEEPSEPEAEHDEDEWTCTACGGPMYRQPHWHYGQCDDCGRREDLEAEEP